MSAAAWSARARPRILLITPDPVLGVALSQYLSGYFAQVALATSVATGCAMVGNHGGGRSSGPASRYAAIVVDSDALDAAVLHGQSPRPRHDAAGQPFAELVSAYPALQGRIVVLGHAQHALSRGAREVLSKPAPGSELLRAIDACVGPGLHKALPRSAGAQARHI